ncbi:MAG: hypothetical protein ACRC02_10640 [Vogesella sp.]|uniref:hypothetical protein n=1 Tax=Vogesella sp. TaxID=1904252 RepID=UPI003F36F6C0
MSRRRSTMLLGMVALLSGCAGQQPLLQEVDTAWREALGKVVAGTVGTLPGGPVVGSGSRYPVSTFQQSGLRGVFDATDMASRPQWPRLAATIKALPQEAYYWYVRGQVTVSPHYCMRMDAVLWQDEKRSKRYPDLVYCFSDAQDGKAIRANYQYMRWRTMSTLDLRHSGLQRTDGPTPPQHNYPQGKNVVVIDDMLIMQLLNAFMSSVGLDIEKHPDEHRFWVVSIPDRQQWQQPAYVLPTPMPPCVLSQIGTDGCYRKD